MNSQDLTNVKMSENVIVADADYVDYVAFQLSVQLERMIGRRIPRADLAQWAVNIALDGGLREDGGQHETLVVLVHDHDKDGLENFAPSAYATEIQGQAFKDEHLGEFEFSANACGNLFNKDQYISDIVRTVLNHDEVKRLMIVPNGEQGNLYNELAQQLRKAPEELRVTMFAMQPMAGGNFRQEMLGYSLMSALGVRAEELG